jgi:serpin B
MQKRPKKFWGIAFSIVLAFSNLSSVLANNNIALIDGTQSSLVRNEPISVNLEQTFFERFWSLLTAFVMSRTPKTPQITDITSQGESVTITWRKSNADGYVIERAFVRGSGYYRSLQYSQIAKVVGKSTYTDSQLVTGVKTYYYRVRAYNYDRGYQFSSPSQARVVTLQDEPVIVVDPWPDDLRDQVTEPDPKDDVPTPDPKEEPPTPDPKEEPPTPDPKEEDPTPNTTDFVKQLTDVYVNIGKSLYNPDSNLVISPLSIHYALSMAANGADGKTLAEFEKLFGISIESANLLAKDLQSKLSSDENGQLRLGNSIWIKDTLKETVKPDFEEKLKSYYQAQLFIKPFDDTTVADVNAWVKEETLRQIEAVLDKINPDVMMYLINAVGFDAEWQKIYHVEQLSEGSFTKTDGSKIPATFMNSKESRYLKDTNAQGFIKPYANGKYSFVALVPDEGVSITDYIKSLSGEKLSTVLKGATDKYVVNASIPKFKASYSLEMKPVLQEFGINDAFEREAANFTRLADGEVYISSVIHKAVIDVDERGTKAGGVTSVEISVTSAPINIEYKDVKLDKPFVYAIIENETNLPVFMGTQVLI